MAIAMIVGGARTKGVARHSYVRVDGAWMTVGESGNVGSLAVPSVCSRLDGYEAGAGSSFKRFPLVTVITPVFNGEAYLRETIASVLGQTYPNVEYIIIDGGSADSTMDIIREDEDRIDYYVSGPDDGIYDAMNKGISLSQGEIIGILNSDDWYEPNAIGRAVREFSGNVDLSLVHGAMNVIAENGRVECVYGSKESMCDLLSPPFNHPTCFVRASAYSQVGLFDLSFPTASDYEFMLRLKGAGREHAYVDEVLANFRKVGVTSRSLGFPIGQLMRLLRQRGFGWGDVVVALSFRAVRAGAVVVLDALGLRWVRRSVGRLFGYHRASG